VASIHRVSSARPLMAFGVPLDFEGRATRGHVIKTAMQDSRLHRDGFTLVGYTNLTGVCW
jgi:hypothetical protein